MALRSLGAAPLRPQLQLASVQPLALEVFDLLFHRSTTVSLFVRTGRST